MHYKKIEEIQNYEDFLELTGSDIGLKSPIGDFLIHEHFSNMWKADYLSEDVLTHLPPKFENINGTKYIKIPNELQAALYNRLYKLRNKDPKINKLLMIFMGEELKGIDPFVFKSVENVLHDVTNVTDFDKITCSQVGIKFFSKGDVGFIERKEFEDMDLLTILPFIDQGPLDGVIITSTMATVEEKASRFEKVMTPLIGLTTINEDNFSTLQTLILDTIEKLSPELFNEVLGEIYFRSTLIQTKRRLYRKDSTIGLLQTFRFDKTGLHMSDTREHVGIHIDGRTVDMTINMNHHRGISPTLETLKEYSIPETSGFKVNGSLADVKTFIKLVIGEDDEKVTEHEFAIIIKAIITANVVSPKTSPFLGVTGRLFQLFIYGKGVPLAAIPYTTLTGSSPIQEVNQLISYDNCTGRPYLSGIANLNGHEQEFLDAVSPIIDELFKGVKLTGIKNHQEVRQHINEICRLDRYMDSLIPNNVAVEQMMMRLTEDDKAEFLHRTLTMLLAIYTDFDLEKDMVEVTDRASFIKTVSGILDGSLLREQKDKEEE